MFVTGGHEHVLQLTNLEEARGILDAFEDLPAEVAAGSLQEKLAYLRDRLEGVGDPLL